MEIGSSQNFVIAQGFRQVEGHWGLIGHDGSLRLFAQLTADPDRPEVRPIEAYRALLSSLQPGWTLRWLQIFWPDPVPRKHFFENAQNWNAPGEAGEGYELLRQGLLLFLQESPLPFNRRTILEFLLPGGKGVALPKSSGQTWWDGLPGLLGTYGVWVKPLFRDEIQELASQIFNPKLD
jgi:hypothetical protein